MKQSEHWTKYLSEAGTITSQGDAQERRLRKIRELRKEIRQLQAEYDQEERSLMRFAVQADYWTVEEVEEAKQRSKEYCSVSEYRECIQKELGKLYH